MQCKGKTKKGSPCKNQASIDGYCHIHYPGAGSSFNKIKSLAKSAESAKRATTGRFSFSSKLATHMKTMDRVTFPGKLAFDKFAFSSPYAKYIETLNKVSHPLNNTIEKFYYSPQYTKQIGIIQRSISSSPVLKSIVDQYSHTSRFAEMAQWGISQRLTNAMKISSFSSYTSNLAQQAMKAVSVSPYLTTAALKVFSSQSHNIDTAFNKYNIKLNNYLPANYYEATFIEVFRQINSSEKENIDDKFSEVATNVDTSIKQDPLTLQSAQAYFGYILALIFYILASNSQEEMKNEIIKKMTKMGDKIIEKFEKQKEQQDTFTYYIVVRAVQLMTKPSTTKSKTIAFLYQNQKVKLVERKGKWIKVEYYNYIEKIHISGWCLKKYLKMESIIKIPQIQ